MRFTIAQLLVTISYLYTTYIYYLYYILHYYTIYYIGYTYAVQLYPNINILSWSSKDCTSNINIQQQIRGHNSDLSMLQSGGILECSPFSNDSLFIITLGYIIITCIFLPFGLGKRYYY